MNHRSALQAPQALLAVPRTPQKEIRLEPSQLKGMWYHVRLPDQAVAMMEAAKEYGRY
jgi:hypothetical protein